MDYMHENKVGALGLPDILDGWHAGPRYLSQRGKNYI